MTRVRIGADIGGTFTDLVLTDGTTWMTEKRLTTHAAPEQALCEGLAALLERSGHLASAVDLIVHGTTLATNALIERKGARTALLTTEGFRDTLELGSESRWDQYDIDLEKPSPLVRRRWRRPIRERMAADGVPLIPLDDDEVRAAAADLRDGGIESVAVGYLHAYANPAHERRTALILAELLPGIPVSVSSEVSPEIREYERITTTVANAYVRPLIAGYLSRLRALLGACGIEAPLLLMLSSGGLTTIDLAMRLPVRLIESGPAGGAAFAADLACRHRLDRVIAFDMGGTTAKLCMIDDFVPLRASGFEAARSDRCQKGSGMPLQIPVVEMVEIGAGGGSIARRDTLGRIVVGPRSAGSEPGPACYGHGGTDPTVTDADLVLGRIDPTDFAGGRVALQTTRADTALTALAADPVDAAYGVAEIVDESMASAARVHAVERGLVLEGRTMIAFGGAAPLHAARLAQKLGLSQVLIPRHAGVGSAVGFLLAPVAFETTRSLRCTLEMFDVSPINSILDALAAEARRVVRQGAPTATLSETRKVFARYVGQGHEIAVPLPARVLTTDDGPMLCAAFDAAYVAQYGRTIPGMVIELLTWSVSVQAAAMPSEPMAAPAVGRAARADGKRAVFNPATAAWTVHATQQRANLRPGDQVGGPALVTEAATTTVVPPGFDLRVMTDGALVLTRAS